MKQRKWDMMLVIGVLLCAAVLWFVMRPGGAGAYAVVTVNGVETARYPLSQERSVTIGDAQYNILTISEGAVCVSDANCGDHTCVRTGRISREGEQIVCLPHKLVISVVGGESSELDAATH